MTKMYWLAGDFAGDGYGVSQHESQPPWVQVGRRPQPVRSDRVGGEELIVVAHLRDEVLPG